MVIDKITINDIKLGGEDLAKIIIRMINLCIEMGVYPEELKK